MTRSSTGARIAAARRRRGLSQVALAGLIGRSESWLSQVERGARPVDSLSVLRNIARVLRVELDALAAPSDPIAPGVVGAAQDGLAIAEAALFERAHRPTPSAAAVAELHGVYQAADYPRMLDVLPGLIAGLGPTAVPRVLASGYTLVAKVFAKFGAHDAAMLAADRAWVAAERGGNPCDVGLATREVVRALHRSPRRSLATPLAVSTAERLTGNGPAVISVRGSLWLVAAVLAARDADGDAARSHLHAASRLADALGVDANHYWTAFGPTNVAVHRVSVAVELGDVESAVAAASSIDLGGLPRALRGRRAQVQLDLAWAQSRRRNDADAVVALLEVERTAPDIARCNALAVDTIRTLLTRARGAHRQAVLGLADRAGIEA